MERKRQELEIYKGNELTQKEGKGNFFSGVLILSLSAVIVKIIGLIYKIPMLRLLGSEGMGYFNSAYEIYALLCIVSTAGLPVAMSIMISGERDSDRVEKIFKISMRLFVILGALGTALMLVLSYPLALFLGNYKSFFSILAIAPTLFFICITSAYRGYFQGLSRMLPTAVSQVIEALGKLILGLAFACVALNAGFGGEIVAAFAVLGLLLGSAASSLYLLLVKRLGGGNKPTLNAVGAREINRELLSLAIPITLSSAVVSVTKMIDMTMILRRLQSIGYVSEEAFAVYGGYTTLCLPLFSLAPALIGSVAMPILPKLSGAIARGDRHTQTETVNDGIRLTSIISMPMATGLALYSRQILELLFHGENEAIELCAPLLTLLAFSVGFSSMVTTGNAILQAYGHPKIPLAAMGAGAILKIVLAYILIGNRSINIAGAPISTFFCDLSINVVSFYFICKIVPGKIRIDKVFVRPFLASVISVGISRIIYGAVSAKYGEGTIITLSAIAVAGLLYCFMCLVLRVIDIKEIKGLLAGRKKTKPDK